ncbi:DUF5711 family protein [uncultured Clostridium sp.]|jgi:hypothetical protein|uniref:DUF5711 family protein n=1 Tax=uncultured Clostridium sp. TaxID=59620 RepID=UPI000334A21C|nr:DUF5711 family protein [uncultured Clostridium sp.]MBP7025391.1 hypothetical protein [Clostridia bacterium]CDC06585.1 putative uncharacterized protein [Clostridium sp. CAG:343]HCF34175.1 hypothetical protein [Clostridiales bacterium]MBP8634212.1 hypothetical protein [Clostridia bacterium]MED9924670.1 DUF5711 family protein [Clostridia bacterium]
MKDIWIDATNKEKKVNKKKIVILTIIIVFIVIAIITIGLYSTNDKAREWIDKNIFRKEVLQDKVATIDLKENQDSNIYAFNKYIGILNKTKFSIYNSTGSQEKTLDLQISNPIWGSANRFLAIAENKGKKVYLISDKDIAWEAEVEGNISQVHVNKNGYVAVVIVDTSYKTVIKTYNPQGKELFNTYLSSTRAVDVSISNDNKYLAIAEVDTSGTMIQSSIKVISIDKASTDPTNSLENTYKGEENKLITNIKYQNKNKLVCMYTDSIHQIENGEDITLIDNQNKKVIFQSVNLVNRACSIEEKSSGLFTADSLVNIVNIENHEIKQYTASSVTKELYTYGNIIAINLGTEVEFISTDGWLVKRYVANQEITNIVVSDSIAGIIYRDKIEIINL